MPRTKKINAVVQYGNTGWIINDCGNGQFELYNTRTKQILQDFQQGGGQACSKFSS